MKCLLVLLVLYLLLLLVLLVVAMLLIALHHGIRAGCATPVEAEPELFKGRNWREDPCCRLYPSRRWLSLGMLGVMHTRVTIAYTGAILSLFVRAISVVMGGKAISGCAVCSKKRREMMDGENANGKESEEEGRKMYLHRSFVPRQYIFFGPICCRYCS